MERALTVLEELRTIVPYEHAEIAYDDPFSGTRRPLVSVGYPDELLAHFHGPEFEASLAELHMFETGQPHRMRDVPGDKLAVRTIAELLIPAGYREGLTMALRTDNGRVTGLLNMSTDDGAHPTDEARDAIGILCATLANVADATRFRPASCCSSWSPARRRWRSGTTAPRSRSPASPATGCSASTRGFCASPAASRCATGAPRASCGRRRTAVGTGSRSRRATTTATPAPRSCPCLPGPVGIDLTRRELEVLTMVTAGWSNGEIGARLSISPRTVGTYVEQILLKLAVPTRAAAAARAVAEGLMVPLEALLPLRSVS